MGDIIVLGVLAVIVSLIIAGMIRNKKKGKCGGCSSCKGCSMAGSCGSQEDCNCSK